METRPEPQHHRDAVFPIDPGRGSAHRSTRLLPEMAPSPQRHDRPEQGSPEGKPGNEPGLKRRNAIRTWRHER